MNNWTDLIRKVWWMVLVPPWKYSHISKSKKKEIQVIFMMAICRGVVAWNAVLRDWMILTGRR